MQDNILLNADASELEKYIHVEAVKTTEAEEIKKRLYNLTKRIATKLDISERNARKITMAALYGAGPNTIKDLIKLAKGGSHAK